MVSQAPPLASGAGLDFLETRQEVNDIDQHGAQAGQETHLTSEVWKEGVRDGSAGKMLPCKHEDLSLVPKTHIKKLGGAQHREGRDQHMARVLWVSSRGCVETPDLQESPSQIAGFSGACYT